ncbi:MAG: hypothetical protein QM504_07265 [Pseudomonadota bacterium]
MKSSLRLFGIIGIILFSGLFALTYSTPEFVERIGKEFIKNKIIEKTQEKVNSITAEKKDSKLGKFVGKLIKNNEATINIYKQKIKNKANEKLAAVIAEMSDLSCECRKNYAKKLDQGYQFKLLSLQHANEKMVDFMKAKYMDVSIKLKTDFRIFTGVNALIFLFLLLASFLKPQAIKHLFLPSVLLCVSTMISSYFYLFEQNWFFTIIYGSYTGWAYLGYLTFVFAILSDIVFNRARITTEILNATIGTISNITFSIC